MVARSTAPTAVLEPVEDGWVQARLEEILAVVTVGRAREEARELLLDAFREDLLSLGVPGVDGGAESERERLELTLR
jgi:hypothetical protein